MKKLKKRENQLIQAKAGIKLFYQDSLALTSYEDLQNYLNNLATYFQQVENDKAINKNIILFKTYLKNESDKKQDIKTIQKKGRRSRTKKKISFFDYLEDYYVLRNRGYSYQKIADYSKKYYKTSVSKETVRKYLLNKDEDLKDGKQ